jgi:DNA-directed RNA polymerase subunit RPC12/RpoP
MLKLVSAKIGRVEWKCHICNQAAHADYVSGDLTVSCPRCGFPMYRDNEVGDWYCYQNENGGINHE